MWSSCLSALSVSVFAGYPAGGSTVAVVPRLGLVVAGAAEVPLVGVGAPVRLQTARVGVLPGHGAVAPPRLGSEARAQAQQVVTQGG